MEREICKRDGPKSLLGPKELQTKIIKEEEEKKTTRYWEKGWLNFIPSEGSFFFHSFHQYKYREENTVQMEER